VTANGHPIYSLTPALPELFCGDENFSGEDITLKSMLRTMVLCDYFCGLNDLKSFVSLSPVDKVEALEWPQMISE
jgi:hypothetical protein